MKHLLNNLSNEEKNRIREQYEGGMKIDTSKFKKLLESQLGNSKPLVSEQGHTLTDFDYERMHSGEDMTYTPYKGSFRDEIKELIRKSKFDNKEIIDALRSIADDLESSGKLKNTIRDSFEEGVTVGQVTTSDATTNFDKNYFMTKKTGTVNFDDYGFPTSVDGVEVTNYDTQWKNNFTVKNIGGRGFQGGDYKWTYSDKVGSGAMAPGQEKPGITITNDQNQAVGTLQF